MYQNLTYDDVSCIFEMNKIWNGEDEFRWYRWCWDVLEKHGMARFSSSYEKALVYVRAYTLFYIYAEICEFLVDEYFSYEVECDEEFLSAAWMGYILAKNNLSSTCDYDLDGMENSELLSECVDTQRESVSKALTDISNNQSPLIIFMYATFEMPIMDDMDEFYTSLGSKEESVWGWLIMGAFKRGLYGCY